MQLSSGSRILIFGLRVHLPSYFVYVSSEGSVAKLRACAVLPELSDKVYQSRVLTQLSETTHIFEPIDH